LFGVVCKYVKIQPKDISVSFESQRNIEVLEVKIELPEAVRA
jgi:cell division topological specificity factor